MQTQWQSLGEQRNRSQDVDRCRAKPVLFLRTLLLNPSAASPVLRKNLLFSNRLHSLSAHPASRCAVSIYLLFFYLLFLRLFLFRRFLPLSLFLSLFLSVSLSLSDAHASQRIKPLSLGEKVVNSKIHCRLFGGMSSGGAGPAFGRVGSQASKDCGGLKKRKRRGRGFARSECSSR